ncbi:Retrovirus-related Pol polyprotein from transposon [Trichinella patagoniensis]|uniref:RNA-directed DNA polymerase n=1 Tax=Trichinella patagoniensis TaxID=990121 RepID=A0A0V0Z369_9BILA|nr:Retrovirus-related Pol polyprotein from transposon [Trichinella patagoniensis]
MALDSASFVERWQKEDTECMRVREWIEKETWPQLAPEGSLWMKRLWSQRGRRVLQEGTVCRTWEIPDTGDSRLFPVILRQNIPKILNTTHNQPTGGHLGVAITLAKVRQRYCCPRQREDKCAGRAVPPRKLQAPVQLQPVSHPFQRVAMDLVGPLEETQSGNRYILVVCDYFSKWPEAFPLPNAEARTVATVLVNGVFCRYGVPKTLHSDQCRNFESELVKKVCQLFGVTKIHPYRLLPAVRRLGRTDEPHAAGHVSEGVHRPSRRLGCLPRPGTAGLPVQCLLHNRSHYQSRCVPQRAPVASGPDVRNAEGGTSEIRRGVRAFGAGVRRGPKECRLGITTPKGLERPESLWTCLRAW